MGLGYVGIQLARQAVAAGYEVVGLDESPQVVANLTAMRTRAGVIDAADLQEMHAQGFRATTDPEVLSAAEVIVICVPTPLTVARTPDLTMLTRAAASIGSRLQRDSLVVLESTTYPGTTDGVLCKILEKESGLIAGQDFALAFSPERVDPGRASHNLVNTPKVVGGYTAACTERARRFYGKFVTAVIEASGTKEAEMSKLLENTYRMVNIALVNEMAVHCHELGIDVWNSIDLAGTKPFGFEAFYPGPGVGGHCIPVDPLYLAHYVREALGVDFELVELAARVNEGMPGYVTRRVLQALRRARTEPRDATVLLLGLSYKPNVADGRGSPAVPIAELLSDRGIRVQYHDPHVSELVLPGADAVNDPVSAAKAADVTVLLQNHKQYDLSALEEGAVYLLDTRGVLKEAERL
ncbi:nucleotide sugar dehydrogenase [Amycolatopsis sp. NPDC049868]|uniref:nucleotide sugar dehydrogenase n=1 Tax=Amycolatopsis sp. NPDC049868 TaxID=3363934 RepID=UPI0037B15953